MYLCIYTLVKITSFMDRLICFYYVIEIVIGSLLITCKSNICIFKKIHGSCWKITDYFMNACVFTFIIFINSTNFVYKLQKKINKK
jgi:hypothetical protein